MSDAITCQMRITETASGDPGIPARITAVLTIDLAAIAANWRLLQQRVGPGCTVAATVKADAYGLGLAPVALALAEAGCRWFYVATLDEAAALDDILRPACSGCRIVLLSGPIPGSAAEIAAIPAVLPVIN